MNISEVFIRRPIATSLLMAALALVGIVAFPLLPVAPLPQVDFPTIQVSATVPGASPETMAATVATPLERQFGQIAGVAQMSSVSSLGSTVVTLQFDLNRNIDGAAQDVQAAITAAGSSLPKNLSTPPTYRKVNPADSPILIVSANSDTVPLPKVDDFAENVVAQQISQISGVAQVAIGGQQKPAIRVQVDPAKLQARQLTLEDVRAALANATTDVAKGTLLGKQQSFTIIANDQLTEADDYNNVIIAYRNGAPVRVRDVGRAIDGPQDVTLGALHRDHIAVMLLVFKQPGANVIDTVDNIKNSLKGMSSLIPPGIHLDIIVDRTQTIRASVKDVEFTLLLSCALVVLVILLFLRSIHATLIPGAAVPLSLLGRHRHHLSARLQPGQSFADGADHRRRLRGRRRDRRRGKHLPPSRGRHHAAAIGDQGRARDRLHRHIDQRFADRGLHSAVADERHRRPAVPRIRHHRHRGDRGVGRGVADADADAVLALPGQRARPRARPPLSRHRMGLRHDPRRLPPRPRLRAWSISFRRCWCSWRRSASPA